MKTHIPTLKKDDDAQVGIGTMIVFIATILVAAVAAGVLINVSGGLQSKAVATGNEATENVASNLMVQSVYGTGASDGSIDTMIIYVTLGSGSEPMDLSTVIAQFSDGAALEDLTGVAAEVRGDGDTILEASELWTLTITPTAPVGESIGVSIDLIPEVGNAASVAFTTPSAFGGNDFVQLF